MPKGAGPTTFLGAPPGESGSAMLLNISPLAAPDAEVVERVDAMERTRSERETAVFDEVRSAMALVGRIGRRRRGR